MVVSVGTLDESFFEEAFKRKAEAKKAGNKALAQVWKIIINSAYEFWGIRVEDKDSCLLYTSPSPRD